MELRELCRGAKRILPFAVTVAPGVQQAFPVKDIPCRNQTMRGIHQMYIAIVQILRHQDGTICHEL
jgi:hypothetical protein